MLQELQETFYLRESTMLRLWSLSLCSLYEVYKGMLPDTPPEMNKWIDAYRKVDSRRRAESPVFYWWNDQIGLPAITQAQQEEARSAGVREKQTQAPAGAAMTRLDCGRDALGGLGTRAQSLPVFVWCRPVLGAVVT